MFHLTGGSPPYIPDMDTPINTNEPYLTVCMQHPLHGAFLVDFRICASGWTSSLQKRKYPRPFQQVMVMTSKQVGSTLTFSRHSLAYHSVNSMQYLQTLLVAYAGILLNLVRSRPAVTSLNGWLSSLGFTRCMWHFAALQLGRRWCWRWGPRSCNAVVLHERRKEPDSIHTKFPCDLPIVSPYVPILFALDAFGDGPKRDSGWRDDLHP